MTMAAEIRSEHGKLEVWAHKTFLGELIGKDLTESDVTKFADDLTQSHCSACLTHGRGNCTMVRSFPGISWRWGTPVAIADTKFKVGQESDLKVNCSLLQK